MAKWHVNLRRWRVAPTVAASLLALSTVMGAVAQGIPSPSEITISIDAPTVGTKLTNGEQTFIGGWAGSSAGGGTGIDHVDVFLDSTAGTRIGRARYGTSRPDVARAHQRPGWENSGFGLNWRPRNLLPGEHTLYVVAYAASGAVATQTLTFTAVSEDAGGCAPSPTCPRLTKLPDGWIVDTGGPGVYFDRDPGIMR